MTVLHMYLLSLASRKLCVNHSKDWLNLRKQNNLIFQFITLERCLTHDHKNNMKHKNGHHHKMHREYKTNNRFTAICTANKYDHSLIDKYLNQYNSGFKILPIAKEYIDAIYLKKETMNSEYCVELPEYFIFPKLGTFVCLDSSTDNINQLINILDKCKTSLEFVEKEQESMDYTYCKSNSSHLNNGVVNLSEISDPAQLILEKYAFSNAMAFSVKLAHWENLMEDLVMSIKHVPENLKLGQKAVFGRPQILQKSGELLYMRRKINLDYDLVNDPEFYWEHDNLSLIYRKMSSYLDIQRRTAVLNKKLDHCHEIVELLREHLNSQHSLYLEWGIIILISIEVVFEFIHYYDKYTAEN